MSLIQRMGFQDPDKKDPKHELVCRYLADDIVSDLLMNSIKEKEFSTSPEKQIPLPTNREVAICKGTGHYKTHVGFIDVLLQMSVLKITEGSELVKGEWEPREWKEWRTVGVFIEVKTNREPLGDFIRQINLYREHWLAVPLCRSQGEPIRRFYLVTTFPLSSSELDDLARADIGHRMISEKCFNDWLQEQKETPIPAQSEI